MRQTILVFLAAVAVLSGVTFATAEDEALALEAEKIEFTQAARLKELEINAREAEFDAQRQMQELEIEERRAELKRSQHRGSEHRRSQRHGKKHGGIACLIGLIMIIVRLLATIWVAGDLQRRKAGSALWIPIVLLGGLFGLGVYAVIRLGDIQQTETA